MEIIIERIETFSESIAPEINSLARQLVANSRMLDNEDVKNLVENQANRFFVAREAASNKIIGMLTLVILDVPSVKKGLLEEIVVDNKHRRKGIGRKLLSAAMKQARKEGASYIDFTSRPERKEAKSFYQKLGFNKRDTNVYRINL